MCSSPRASSGLSMLPASIAPSAAPAPTTVCSSSTNSRMWPSALCTSLSTALSRSSNSPRYFAPATRAPMSRAKTVLSRSPSGTSPSAIRWARPSTIAVLPTPGSPISTGLFLLLRDRIWMVRRISESRPITGSSLPAAACRDEVAAVLLQRLVGPLGRRRRHPLVTAHLGQRRQEAVAGQPLSVEEPPGRRARALLHQGDHEVLDRDVLVLEPAGLAVGRVEQPREPLGDVHLPGRHAGPADPRAAAELGLQVLAEPVRIGSRPGEQRRDQALRLGRAAPAAGARRPPRCGRSAAPWSGRRAEPPATSGSVGSCPWSASSS